jgi:hypothetical protein
MELISYSVDWAGFYPLVLSFSMWVTPLRIGLRFLRISSLRGQVDSTWPKPHWFSVFNFNHIGFQIYKTLLLILQKYYLFSICSMFSKFYIFHCFSNKIVKTENDLKTKQALKLYSSPFTWQFVLILWIVSNDQYFYSSYSEFFSWYISFSYMFVCIICGSFCVAWDSYTLLHG